MVRWNWETPYFTHKLGWLNIMPGFGLTIWYEYQLTALFFLFLFPLFMHVRNKLEYLSLAGFSSIA